MELTMIYLMCIAGGFIMGMVLRAATQLVASNRPQDCSNCKHLNEINTGICSSCDTKFKNWISK